MLVPKALVCRAELHTMRQWGHLTKPSKHLGTTGIQDHKLPTCTSTCFPGMALWAACSPGDQKEPRETGCSQAGKSHLSEVLQTLQKCNNTSSVVNEK